MPGPVVVAPGSTRRCGRASSVDGEVHPPAAGVAEGVADDLRHRRRDTRLLRSVEFEQGGDLGGAPARRHDILIVVEVEREQ